MEIRAEFSYTSQWNGRLRKKLQALHYQEMPDLVVADVIGPEIAVHMMALDMKSDYDSVLSYATDRYAKAYGQLIYYDKYFYRDVDNLFQLYACI